MNKTIFKIFGHELTLHPSKHTRLHPEYKTLTEFAFEIQGKKYYEFISLLDMPTRRYKRVMEFIREAELSITSTDLVEMLNLSVDYLNKGDLAKSIVIQNSLTTLAQQFIETDTYYRLFSCCFFTEDEDLTDYDFDYNDEKIKDFKSEKVEAFFLTEPMKKFLPLPDISTKDINTFSRMTKANKQQLSSIKQLYTSDKGSK